MSYDNSKELDDVYYKNFNFDLTKFDPYDNNSFFSDYINDIDNNYSKEDDDNYLENQKPPKNEENESFIINNQNYKISSQVKKFKTPNIALTKVTAENSVLPPKQIIIMSKKKIFEIKKIKNNEKGRKRNNQIYIKKKKHTKINKDNILIKIHRRVFKNTLEFINSILRKSKNSEINSIQLKKNDNSRFSKYNNKIILNLLKMKLKDLLSYKLSRKFKKKDKDYNRKKIDFILDHGDKDIISVINITFKEILDIYCSNGSNNNNELFKDFIKLDDDIKIFEKQNLEKNFIEKYENIAKNYENIINNINPRPKNYKNKQID